MTKVLQYETMEIFNAKIHEMALLLEHMLFFSPVLFAPPLSTNYQEHITVWEQSEPVFVHLIKFSLGKLLDLLYQKLSVLKVWHVLSDYY